jgi:hypothetical protein
VADQEFDFSDLPEVKAENAEVVEAAGIPTAPAPEMQDIEPVMDEVELQDLGKELELQEQYGNAPLTTFTETAVGEATFGLSDRMAQAIGITSQEAQRERAERNPLAAGAGTITGVVAPAIASMGTSAAAKGASVGARAIARAAAAAEKQTAKVVAKVVADTGEKKLAREVLKKSIEKGVGGAVEGAAYGAGHLAREDAIGTADFNAENILSSAGTGALYGGIVGAALPSVALTAASAKDSAKKLFGKALSKYTDASKAAEEISGFNAAKLAKLNSTESGKKILAELPDWYKNEVKIGMTDDAAAILEKVKAVKQSAGSQIEATLAEADVMAAQSLGSKANSPEMRSILLNKVASDIEAKFLAPIREDKVFRAEAQEVRNLIDDLRTSAYRKYKKKGITSKELVDLKRKMDSIYERAYERGIGAKRTRLEKAAFEARQLLNDASYAWLTHIDSRLADQLRAANRNYQLASTVELPLLRKSVKDPSFLGFKDALYGLGGAVLGDAGTGALLLGGKKLLESDLRRRLVILGGLEKSQVRIATDIADNVKQFLTKGARPSKLASIAALTNSAIAQKREDGKKPQAPRNRVEAYRNAADNIQKLVVQSDELMNRSQKAGAVLAHAAPLTAEAVTRKTIKAINFLAAKIPKRPYETLFPSGKQRDFTPSSMEIARFERYLQVVDSPMTVLQELKQGTLTREHVEALRTVYPDLYSRIQQQVLAQLQDAKEDEIPYSKRVQVSILLDIPGDDSLLGKNVAALQANFTRQEQDQSGGPAPAVQSSQSGVQNLEKSERAGSDVTSFMTRRNQG